AQSRSNFCRLFDTKMSFTSPATKPSRRSRRAALGRRAGGAAAARGPDRRLPFRRTIKRRNALQDAPATALHAFVRIFACDYMTNAGPRNAFHHAWICRSPAKRCYTCAMTEVANVTELVL